MDLDDGPANAPAYAQRPDTLRQLRACKFCKLIKTLDQFTEAFCENCWADWADGTPASSLARGRRHDAAIENTTSDYEGMVAMMRPENSWVARWLKMHKLDDDSGARVPFKPGLYAISLPGEEVEAAKHLARRGGAGDEEDEYEDDGADDDDESGGEGEAELDDDDMGAGAGAASSSSSAGARRKGGRTGGGGGARAGAGAGAGASSSSSSSRGAGTVRFEADPEAQQEAVEAALVEPDEDDDE